MNFSELHVQANVFPPCERSKFYDSDEIQRKFVDTSLNQRSKGRYQGTGFAIKKAHHFSAIGSVREREAKITHCYLAKSGHCLRLSHNHLQWTRKGQTKRGKRRHLSQSFQSNLTNCAMFRVVL